ncbi:FAD synthase [Candidatus Bathyarchaeota archaeon]|nr:FAD synthase [Candidatus Bathyarchaeota archaeon]
MKVLASGVFDLIHYGHIRYLEESKNLGGDDSYLIVIVASDETVSRVKGHPPIMPENQRKALVESLKMVDEVIIGYKDLDFDKVIQKIKPDIVAIGHDQHDIEEQVKKLILNKNYKIRIKKIPHFSQDNLDSSSKIKKKIVEGSGKKF